MIHFRTEVQLLNYLRKIHNCHSFVNHQNFEMNKALKLIEGAYQKNEKEYFQLPANLKKFKLIRMRLCVL